MIEIIQSCYAIASFRYEKGSPKRTFIRLMCNYSNQAVRLEIVLEA